MNNLEPKIWVDKYGDALFRFAIKRTLDYDISLDLVQDTFLSALLNIDTFKGEISEKNWLYLILKRKVIDYYRKNLKDKFVSLDAIDEENNSFFDENGRWMKESFPEPWTDEQTKRFEEKEMLGIIERCVNKLKEIQKAVFIMKYIDDIDAEDICKELEISKNNFWVILHRARLNVRNCTDKFLKVKSI